MFFPGAIDARDPFSANWSLKKKHRWRARVGTPIWLVELSPKALKCTTTVVGAGCSWIIFEQKESPFVFLLDRSILERVPMDGTRVSTFVLPIFCFFIFFEFFLPWLVKRNSAFVQFLRIPIPVQGALRLCWRLRGKQMSVWRCYSQFLKKKLVDW